MFEPITLIIRQCKPFNLIQTNVAVLPRNTLNDIANPVVKWKAIWDTGATVTAISYRVIETLGLIEFGKDVIQTANGKIITNTYLIDLWIEGKIMMRNVLASCADIQDDFDVLIGLDIINKGEFSLTHENGFSVFRFEITPIKNL